MSPDSTSSIYPDRPILPLPKRRLRERLSPDVAESIKYPPVPQTTAPLFVYPYSPRDEPGLLNLGTAYIGHQANALGRGVEADVQRAFVGSDARDDAPLSQQRRSLASRPSPEAAGIALRTQQRTAGARHVVPQPPPSTASSADGYDSFENLNNKKKRKIPTAGESILNSAHVLVDSGPLGIPSPPTTGDEGTFEPAGTATTPYYQSGAAAVNGSGISGPGRGRYGRVRNGRSPLRVLSDPNSAWPGRAPKLKQAGQYPSSPPGENVGIISSAIASAEKQPLPPGQENVSLLQQRQNTIARNNPGAPTQFTFTFDSHNPVSWPGSDPAPGGYPGYHHSLPRGMAGDQRDVYNNRSSQSATLPQGSFPGGPNASNPGFEGNGKGSASANGTPRKTKKRGNSLMQAARRRKQQTEEQNYHNPPAPEDMWMCEFCEYESIFGHAPMALIRQYEIKDRKRRREEAERRRLLEKAKMKSRKGKKASKLPAKNNTTTSDRGTASATTGQSAPPLQHEGNAETPSEKYEEDYYEDDVPDDHLPPLEPITHGSNGTRRDVGVPGDGGGSRSAGSPRPVPLSA